MRRIKPREPISTPGFKNDALRTCSGAKESNEKAGRRDSAGDSMLELKHDKPNSCNPKHSRNPSKSRWSSLVLMRRTRSEAALRKLSVLCGKIILPEKYS